MPKEKKIIPKLRFPEFDGEWNMEDLEQCLDYLQPTPYLVESTNYKNEYETPVLTAGKSFVLGYTDEKEGIFKDELPVIIFDDFTTASKFVDFPFKVKSSAMKILLAKDNSDIKFVYESMQNLRFEVGVHKRHWISVFSQLQIPVPNPKEQQKIAFCFSSLDELIESHSQKLELLKNHKKGLMQNLFPQEGEKVPKFRFPQFEKDKEWTSYTLKDLTKINQGLQISISERYTEKVENSFFYITNEFLKSNSERTYYIKNPPENVRCKKEDVLMTRTGNTGQVVTGVSGAFHNNFFKIQFDRKILNKDFLVYFLRLPDTQHIIMSFAGASTIPDLNHSDFYRITIKTPLPKEQKKIASCLSALDELIIAEADKIEQLQQHKKGLMQGLFPIIEN